MNNLYTHDEDYQDLLMIYNRLDESHKRFAHRLINGVLVLQNSGQNMADDCGLMTALFVLHNDITNRNMEKGS